MEALRLQGNSYFTSDVTHALVCYLEAMKVYEEKISTTRECRLSNKHKEHHHQQNKFQREEEQEYAKSAGNALTCLYKLHEYEMCSVIATRILLFNPILAKANVFLARCIAQLEHLPFMEVNANNNISDENRHAEKNRETHTENCAKLRETHASHTTNTTTTNSSTSTSCCNVITDATKKGQTNNMSNEKMANQMNAAVRMWTYLFRACYELPSLNNVVKDDMQNVLRYLINNSSIHVKEKQEEWEKREKVNKNIVNSYSSTENCTANNESSNDSHDSEVRHCDEKEKEAIVHEDYSHAVEITEQEVCGRGVVASQFIPSHCVVSSLLSPFSVGLYIDYNSEINLSSIDSEEQFVKVNSEVCCLHCSKVFIVTENSLPLQCTKCKQAIYCSELCASLHKSRHNVYECNAFIKLHHMLRNIAIRQIDVPCEFAELAFHVITTVSALHIEFSRESMTPTPLEHHEMKIKTHKNRSNNVAEQCIKMLDSHTDEVVQHLHPSLELLKELLPNESPLLLAHILGAIRCNALQISDSSGYPLGQALYVHDTDHHSLSMCVDECSNKKPEEQESPIRNMYNKRKSCTSFFNHSCSPNCSLSDNCIITTQPVLCGEELTIAYIPHLYWPTERRRELLAERYFFTCHCSRCESGESNLTLFIYESTNYFGGAQSVICKNKCNESSHSNSVEKEIKLNNKTVGDANSSSNIINCDSNSAGTSDYIKKFEEWKCNALTIYNNSNFPLLQKKVVNNAFECAIQVARVSEDEIKHTWTGKVQVICNEARSLLADEVNDEAIERVEKLYKELQEKVYPFHFLMHELRNTLTFLYAVRGDHKKCLLSCAYELLMWECIIPGALPVKRMKLENMMRCLSELNNVGSVNMNSILANDQINTDSNTVLIPYVSEL